MDTITLNAYAMQAQLNPFGAELRSLRRSNGENILWPGNNAVWGRTAPTVFPVLGGWPKDIYTVNGVPYRMQKNGFARTAMFSVEEQAKDHVCFSLCSSPETLSVFPFAFCLSVLYTLRKNGIQITYHLTNPGERSLPWILGAHPGFCWSREPGAFLRFPESQNAEAFHPDGTRVSLLRNSDTLQLTADLFAAGAYSTNALTGNWVEYHTGLQNSYTVRIYREDFPYLTLWSMDRKDALFVCLEPTTGAGKTGNDLMERCGISLLAPGASEKRSLIIELINS